MDPILDFGIQVVVFIQNLGGWLLTPMDFFSQLGSRYFFLIITGGLYWCVSTTIGLRLAIFMIASGSINSVLKLLFLAPRPYWYSNEVKAYAAEGSFGIPSGHAQGAIVLWSTLAAWIYRAWAWLGAGVLIFFISVSRLYLGVHFPMDILAGWLIGILLVLGFFSLERKTLPWFTRQTTTIQIALAFLASLGIIGMGLAARWIAGDWQMPTEWRDNALRADGGIPQPLELSSLITNAGALLGMAVGGICLLRSGGYAAGEGTAAQKITRYFLGMVLTAILMIGLKFMVPDGNSLLSHMLLYLSYIILGAWFTGLAPLAFIRLGLARR